MELQLYTAYASGNNLKSLDQAVLKKQLSEILYTWIIYSGVRRTPGAEELTMIRTFIRKNFSALTLEEIRLAVDLVAAGKIVVDNPYHFAPNYVGQILSRFAQYRDTHLKPVLQQRDRMKDKTIVPTAETHAEALRRTILTEYNIYRSTGEVSLNNNIFIYLWRNKLLIIDEAVTKVAKKYGQDRLREDIQNVAKSLQNTHTEPDWADPNTIEIVKKYAQNYFVQLFFDRVEDINAFVAHVNDNQIFS